MRPGRIRLALAMALATGFLPRCHASAQARSGPPATVVEPGFTIHVVARRLASPDGDAAALHWVAEPFLSPATVVITDPAVKTAVVALLARLSAGEAPCSVWVFENSNTCTLTARLERDLGAFSFRIRDQADLLDPPDQEGRELSLTLRVEYMPSAAPVSTPVVRSLAVRVATDHAVRNTDANVTVTARDAATRLGAAAPPAPWLEVPIELRFADTDRLRPREPSFTRDRLEDALLQVALNAIRLAHDAGLAPNGPPPTDEALTAIDERIRLVYALERPPWPARVSTTHSATGDEFFLEVRALRLVSKVNLTVGAAIVERQEGRFTFQGATPAGEARLAALRAAAAARAMRALAARGDSLEGTVPTTDQMADTIAQIRQQADIALDDVQSDADGVVTFRTSYRDVESELQAKIDLQAAVDPEQILVGNASVREHNGLYALVHRNIQEDANLTVNGGPQVQGASLNLTIPREKGVTHVISYGFDGRALVNRDANQRFGNLPPVPGQDDRDTQLVDREWGLVPALFLQYEARTAWKHRLRWVEGLDWRRVLIRPRLDTLPVRVEGLLAAWDHSLEYRLSHDFTPPGGTGGGVGEVSAVAEGQLRQGTTSLSGDFDFSRPQVSASVEGLFGWRSRHDFFLRYNSMVGDSSDRTPLFQLYRLGGSTNVRGIEEGEFVGQSLRAQQLTAGVRLAVFWPALGRSGAPPALANAYLTTFYDRGRITLDHLARDADGYGIGVELRDLPAGNHRAHLAIGWARSPQSVLHRRGVMTAGVHFSF